MLMIFVLSLLFFTGCHGQGAEGKYVVNFDSPVYVVSGDEYVDTSKIMCERYNESTAYMHGEIEFLKKMDNLVVEVILQKEASGKLEVMFSHDICDLCKELGDQESDYSGYLQYFGIPSSCPFDAGSFGIHNLIVDTEQFNIQDQHCGAYLAEIIMYEKTGENCNKDREKLCSIKMEMTIEREG